MSGLIGRSGELPAEGHFPSLRGATDWLNSAQLGPKDLRGKVVVVNFCTYTCINWLRTLPYVRAWAETYERHGVVTIGVHTPEFSFEHDLENVRRALKEMEVTYPIAVDNDYAVWNAFSNNYWPALYFIDAEGRIRHHRFGEGDYERSEHIIQQLLRDAGAEDVTDELAPVDPRGPEVATQRGSSIQGPICCSMRNSPSTPSSSASAPATRRHVSSTSIMVIGGEIAL